VEGSEPVDVDELTIVAAMIADGTISSMHFSKRDPETVQLLRDAVASFGCFLQPAKVDGDREWRINRDRKGGNPGQENPVKELLKDWGVAGLAHEKSFPPRIWRVPNTQLAHFVGVLWTCDGWVGPAVLEYGCASEKLARDLQHALLRLGITSALKFKENAGRGCWTVGVRNAANCQRFLERIPLFGLRKQQAAAMRPVVGRVHGLPHGQFEDIARQIRTEGPCEYWKLFRSGNIRLSYAKTLNSPTAKRLASPDVLWDTIVSIEPVGLQQVYDLTVPTTAAFVANDFYVHNTALFVDSARRIAEQGIPVLGFSGETGDLGMRSRIIANMAGIDSRALRGERIDAITDRRQQLSRDEWARVDEAIEALDSMPLYLDFASVDPDRILAAIERTHLLNGIPFDQRLLVEVDYLQHLSVPEGDNIESRTARASAEFKGITKITGNPLLIYSQLVRLAEGVQVPQLNWFRGSGRIEADADAALVITGERAQGAEVRRSLWLLKQREGDAGIRFDFTMTKPTCRWEEATQDASHVVAFNLPSDA
jgi:replicative DNA helicase